ncbi:MAG: crossover junction endodeoxyribonuclease RuvC [Nitrospirota bacterium]
MKVLGIDPGSITCGFGIIEDSELDSGGQNLLHIASGSIETSRLNLFSERIKEVFDSISNIIEKYNPDEMAIESLFFSKNVKAALRLGEIRGATILAAVNAGIPVFEYTPLEIKKSVVGYGSAAKHQIQYMIGEILHLRESSCNEDAADALALAICHINNRKSKIENRRSKKL